MFSENTLTFKHGKNGVINELTEKIHNLITDRLEEIKFGNAVVNLKPQLKLNFTCFLAIIAKELTLILKYTDQIALWV